MDCTLKAADELRIVMNERKVLIVFCKKSLDGTDL